MHTEYDSFGEERLQTTGRAAWQELVGQAAQQAADGKPWLLKLLSQGGTALATRYALWKRRLERLRPGERKRLQRRLGVSLAGAALLLALTASPGAGAPGAIINVTDSTGTIANDSACSLPEAIINANANNQSGSTDCTAGSGADTIYLDTDVTLTSVHNTTYGATGLPVVSSVITIEGQGNTISRDSGAPTFRILAVGSGGNLTLNSATVSGGVATGSAPANRGGGIYVSAGLLTVTNSTLSGNSAGLRGGGIYTSGSTVTITNSALSGNSAVNGGGMYVGFSATAAVTDSTISGNSASTGAGIDTNSASVVVMNSTLSGNSAGFGGGMRIFRSTVTVTNSILSGNSASFGGGIYDLSASLIVANSTLSGNSAGTGGGIYARIASLALSNSTLSGNSASLGGGLAAGSATVTVTNSTLSGNSAGFGGGIHAIVASVAVMNSTLSGNSASTGGGIRVGTSGTVTVQNSIVAVQTAGGDCSNLGTLASGGYNIESGTSCGFTGTGDQPNVSSASLNLKPLANTGGPTETRALGFGSFALDQIDLGTNGCGDLGQTDQRGITRPQDWGAVDSPQKCDVGAWEGRPNQDPNAVTLKGLQAAAGGEQAGMWAMVAAGLAGLGLSAFVARRRRWRRPGAAPAPSATASPPAAFAPSLPGYTPPAITSRGQLKHFAGSPLVVDPLALPGMGDN